MSYARTDDGVSLYYEQLGKGETIIWIHEFAGDHRSWEPQLRHFSQRFHCVTFGARGYPPSDVPQSPKFYSQNRAAQDIEAVLDTLQVERAHVVGLSMGGFSALHFALNKPGRVLSLTVAGIGYGSQPEFHDEFVSLSNEAARQFERLGAEKLAQTYGSGASRIQFRNKDFKGWSEFVTRLSEHDSIGSANTMRGVQAARPSLYELEDRLRSLVIPVLIICGDEDDHCLQPSIYLKQTIPAAGLLILPKTGHTINLGEPDAFNKVVDDFIALNEAGRWWSRDPKAAEQIMQLMPEDE